MSKMKFFGAIEGFYGKPWNPLQRIEMIRWISEWGMNLFVYGPKDDIHVRTAWRACYCDDDINNIRQLSDACRGAGIRFMYAIGPGPDVHYADKGELVALQARLKQLHNAGVKDYCLLYDDIPLDLRLEDQKEFKTLAGAQSHLTNCFKKLILELDAEANLFFCPTEYCGRFANPNISNSTYLKEIGLKLHPEILVFWTGDEIVSETITIESLKEVGKILKRKPVIWENFHANDYDIRRVYLGPLTGRNSGIIDWVNGFVTNPNNEFEANYIPIFTTAKFCVQSESWNAEKAQNEAIQSWLPRFGRDQNQASIRSVQMEDVELLVDLFKGPFQPGQMTAEFLRMLDRLLASHPLLWMKEEALLEAYEHILKFALRVIELFEVLTAIANRDLLYSLYPYAWEVKEEMQVLISWLKWTGKNSMGDQPFSRKEANISNTTRLGVSAAIHERIPLPTYWPEKKPMGFKVRQARTSDMAELYDICIRTGNNGEDARHLYKNHDALGTFYVGPYLVFEPELAYVLEDKLGVCGYVLGARDSKQFFNILSEFWLPQHQKLFPMPKGDPNDWDLDKRISALIHYPKVSLPDSLNAFPAHVHIDLLPRARKKGNGRQMTETLLESLKKLGIKGVFLEVGIKNINAQSFYERLGFKKLDETDSQDSFYMIKKL